MWTYENELISEDISAKYYGFIYCITNLQNGKKYIGRKYFTKSSSKQVKGKRKKIRKESDWKDYWGSSQKLIEEITQIGVGNFKREVIRLCKTRGECNYWEAKIQFEQESGKYKFIY